MTTSGRRLPSLTLARSTGKRLRISCCQLTPSSASIHLSIPRHSQPPPVLSPLPYRALIFSELLFVFVAPRRLRGVGVGSLTMGMWYKLPHLCDAWVCGRVCFGQPLDRAPRAGAQGVLRALLVPRGARAARRSRARGRDPLGRPGLGLRGGIAARRPQGVAWQKTSRLRTAATARAPSSTGLLFLLLRSCGEAERRTAAGGR